MIFIPYLDYAIYDVTSNMLCMSYKAYLGLTVRIFNLAELGAAIRSARSAKGLSQSDLAKTIGATQEWVSRLENGRLPNPGLATVLHACSTIDLAFFIGVDQPPSGPNVPAEASGDLALGTPSFLQRR